MKDRTEALGSGKPVFTQLARGGLLTLRMSAADGTGWAETGQPLHPDFTPFSGSHLVPLHHDSSFLGPVDLLPGNAHLNLLLSLPLIWVDIAKPPSTKNKPI